MTLIVMPIAIYGISCKDGSNCIDILFYRTKSEAELRNIFNTNMTDDRNFGNNCISYFPFMISMANILSNIICFKIGKAACKIVAQKLCFALPLVLSTPAAIGIFLGFYTQTTIFNFGSCLTPLPVWKNKDEDPTVLFNIIDTYWVVIAAGALGYFSLLLVSNHVWSPSKERLIATDRYNQ
jgi:hypothetical protein